MQSVSSYKGPDFGSLGCVGPLSSLLCTLGPGSLGQNLKVRVRVVHKPPGACTSGTVNCSFILPLGQKKKTTKRCASFFYMMTEKKKEINSLVAAFLARAPLLKRRQSHHVKQRLAKIKSFKSQQWNPSIKSQHCWRVLPLTRVPPPAGAQSQLHVASTEQQHHNSPPMYAKDTINNNTKDPYAYFYERWEREEISSLVAAFLPPLSISMGPTRCDKIK